MKIPFSFPCNYLKTRRTNALGDERSREYDAGANPIREIDEEGRGATRELGTPRRRNMFSRETKRNSLEFGEQLKKRLGCQETFKGSAWVEQDKLGASNRG